MTLDELRTLAKQAIGSPGLKIPTPEGEPQRYCKLPSKPEIRLIIRGAWGTSNKKRLCGNRGPTGVIVEDFGNKKNGYYLNVVFDAQKVFDFCEKEIKLTSGG